MAFLEIATVSGLNWNLGRVRVFLRSKGESMFFSVLRASQWPLFKIATQELELFSELKIVSGLISVLDRVGDCIGRVSALIQS